MSFKETIIFAILASFTILMAVITIKNLNRKSSNQRTIEYVDPKYDKKYPKNF